MPLRADKPKCLYCKLNQHENVSHTDEQIRQMLQADTEAAFGMIYASYYAAMRNIALKYLDDADEAKDAVQHCMISLWKLQGRYAQIGNIKAYLCRSVRNTCLNMLRDSAKNKGHLSGIDLELLDIACAEPEPDESRYLQVAREIEKLPPQCRRVLEMNRFQGLSYKEIAAELDISQRTVDAHLAAAMKQLRKKLSAVLVLAAIICFAGVSHF
jgi:RNA polymerase sigma-70 factor, ECF subfamily